MEAHLSTDSNAPDHVPPLASHVGSSPSELSIHSPPAQKKLKLRRKDKINQARSSNEEDSDSDVGEGVEVLYSLFARKVTLQPDGTVLKSGKGICIEEADALRVASRARLPVPVLLSASTSPQGGKHRIRMSHVAGRTLKEAWPDLGPHQKRDVARQLRQVLVRMRSVAAPENLVGGCDGAEIRDTRVYFTHRAPSRRDEAGFNAYLLSGLQGDTPRPIREALASRLRTDHKIVLSHCDLSPRNIIVGEEGARGALVVRGIVDWEDAGWYPEYWEYVKFFQRSTSDDGDWRDYAGEIFPTEYRDELVDFIALTAWSSP